MTLASIGRASITCVVADDHPPIIDAVTRYLVASDFSVLASVQNGELALAAITRHRPTVCIADVRMPGIDGVELARRARKTAPETAILLYSGFSERGLVADALDAGARGFALKDAPLSDLARAVDLVAGGSVYVDPVLAAGLARNSHPEDRAVLSPREREVLRLLAGGGSYGEIGTQLYLSPDTVRAHAHRAMTKLGARTRTQAVATALREALIA
jgi:DNA-binding NarL/FixJ family response regulator